MQVFLRMSRFALATPLDASNSRYCAIEILGVTTAISFLNKAAELMNIFGKELDALTD